MTRPEDRERFAKAVVYLKDYQGDLSVFWEGHPELQETIDFLCLAAIPRASLPATVALPPLPVPSYLVSGTGAGWSAVDMHAYARAAIEAASRGTGDAESDVLTERQRQMSVEGWTPAHDDEHSDRSLASAAFCYVGHYVGRAWTAEGGDVTVYQSEPLPDAWPWHESAWKPKDPRRDLVRAGALILAELERIDRARDAAQGTDRG